MSSRTIVYTLGFTAAALLNGGCSSDPTRSIVEAEVKTAQPGTTRGFVWSRESGLHIIPLPTNASRMDVTALNDAGQVAGYVTEGNGTEAYRAFVWSEGEGYRALGSLAGPDGISLALAISESGEVTGLSEGPSTKLNGPMGIQLGDFFSWTAQSGMRPTGAPGFLPEFKPVTSGGKLILPSGTECIEVAGVNDNGQAVGYAGWPTTTGCRFTVALLWNAVGVPVEIAKCGSSPWCETTVTDVNNRGDVVGYRGSAGFKWSASGGFAWVPMKNTSLRSINDHGDAAGAVGTGEVSTPFVWMSSGEVRKIELPPGAVYGYAVGINQKGQVSGNFN